MDTESLHTLSATVMGLGIIFTGLGGFGLYCFSRAAGTGTEPQRNPAEVELLAKLSTLQKRNEELQQRLRLSQPEALEKEPEESVREPARTPASRPFPVPVKTPPPPALADWAGSSVLEEMIESSIPAELPDDAVLSGQKRRTITAILRKYTDRSISIHSVAGDGPAFEFAQALKAVFVEGGWRVTGVERVVYAKPPAGLFITSGTFTSPEEAIIPHEALTGAGYEVSRCVDSNLKGENAVLLVGVSSK